MFLVFCENPYVPFLHFVIVLFARFVIFLVFLLCCYDTYIKCIFLCIDIEKIYGNPLAEEKQARERRDTLLSEG